MHYYQFNIGDYASHTSRLSPMEDLAYRRLLDLYYLNEQPLNGCITDVAREIGLVEQADSVGYVLSKFFTLTDGVYNQKRIDIEIKKYKSNHKNKKKAGVASAKARQAKAKKEVTDVEQVLNTDSTGEQLNINQEPLTKNHKPVIKDLRPDGLNSEAWDRWIAFRAKCKFKKYKTDSAMKKLITMGDKETQALIVQQSIDAEYQGLFPIKQSFKSQKPADNWDDDNWHKDLGM